MDFARALAFLDEHVNLERLLDGRAKAAPTLDRMRSLVGCMGDPQAQYRVVHITGTNGKTSTAAMVTQLLVASGLSVGTYTSPHLERINERMAWNGETVTDGAFAELIDAIGALEPLAGGGCSYFELLTAAAFRWFADIAVDAAVVEVGLGGRWDATNVADGQVAVITSIGLDHTEFLGPTRADVAGEKVGIVKPGATLVLGETDADLAPIFRQTPAAAIVAREVDFSCSSNLVAHGGRLLDIRTHRREYEGVFLPAHGAHQGDNAACAVAACESFFDAPLSEDVVAGAFANVDTPGRFEVVGHRPLCILDGIKNAEGARASAATLEEEFGTDARRIVVIGVLQGRDPLEIVRALQLDRAALVITCPAPSPRAVPADELAGAAEVLGVATRVTASVEEAVHTAMEIAQPEDVVLVTGSLYVVGAARTLLRQ